MINRILHSWSFHMKFMKLAEARFINFISNDHSCKIFYIVLTRGIASEKVKEGGIACM